MLKICPIISKPCSKNCPKFHQKLPIFQFKTCLKISSKYVQNYLFQIKILPKNFKIHIFNLKISQNKSILGQNFAHKNGCPTTTTTGLRTIVGIGPRARGAPSGDGIELNEFEQYLQHNQRRAGQRAPVAPAGRVPRGIAGAAVWGTGKGKGPKNNFNFWYNFSIFFIGISDKFF